MNPDNQPTLLNNPAGSGAPESFEQLTKLLNNHPKSVAMATFALCGGMEWKAALEVSEKASSEEEGTAVQQRA